MLVGTGREGTPNHGQSLSNHKATKLGSPSIHCQMEAMVAYVCFVAITKYQKLDNL